MNREFLSHKLRRGEGRCATHHFEDGFCVVRHCAGKVVRCSWTGGLVLEVCGCLHDADECSTAVLEGRCLKLQRLFPSVSA